MQTQTSQGTKDTAKRKRSYKLNSEERRVFNSYAKNFDTIGELAEDLELNRDTVSDLKKKKTCGPDTYQKLQAKIFNTQTAA